MSRYQAEPADEVDHRRAQWAVELPDTDTRGMAVWGRMRRLTLAVRPRIEAIFSRHGIDSGEFDVIGTLLRSGQPHVLRPTELYRWLMITSGGLTARLGRLEKAGLVARDRDPADSRSSLVRLTEKGKAVAQKAFREDMALEAELLSTLSKEDFDQLETLLRKLSLAIEATEGRPGAG